MQEPEKWQLVQTKFMETLTGMTSSGRLMDPPKLFKGLFYTKDMPAEEMEAAVLGQVAIARQLLWAAEHATSLFSYSWVSQNINPLRSKRRPARQSADVFEPDEDYKLQEESGP